MIKLKNYNETQLKVINDYSQLERLIDIGYSIREEYSDKKTKIVYLTKVLFTYMALRKQELLDIGVSKKDADYVVKQELIHLNFVLKEFNNAIPKNN